MRNFLLNVKTLVVEFVALVAGFLWGRNTDWELLPVILTAISALGIVIFLVLRFLDQDKPIVELKLIAKGASRSPPGIIEGVSPKGSKGQNVIEVGGTYLFHVSRDFELIAENKSKNKALNLTLYKSKDPYPLEYKSNFNFAGSLVGDNPKKVELTYRVKRPMTHNDAEQILKAKIPQDLNNITFLLSYQSESRDTYYTKFTPPDKNQHLHKSADLSNFQKV